MRNRALRALAQRVWSAGVWNACVSGALIGCGAATERVAPAHETIAPATTPSPEPPTSPAADEWTLAPVSRSLPGSRDTGHTYFRDDHATRSGTFRAMFDSVMDERDSVGGTFRVASFRYSYAPPIGETGSPMPLHDESVHTVLLDCQEALSGTLETVYKLRGEVVKAERVSDDEVLMMQTRPPSTVNDLCAFLAERAE